MKITGLKPLSKGLFAVEITTDKSTEMVELHQETVFAHHLVKQLEIDSKTWKKIRADDRFNRLYVRAVNLLARRDYTARGLKAKLRSITEDEPLLESVIKRLETNRFINETRALDMVLEDFFSGPPKGPEQLRQTLIKAYFANEQIEEALKQYTPEREQARCTAYLEQAFRGLAASSKAAAKRKLFAGAMNRGFSFETIESSLSAFSDTLAGLDDQQVLENKLDRYQRRYNINDPKEKQKLIQKLLREGFTYDHIKKHLK